jgi:hypothetical protein
MYCMLPQRTWEDFSQAYAGPLLAVERAQTATAATLVDHVASRQASKLFTLSHTNSFLIAFVVRQGS